MKFKKLLRETQYHGGRRIADKHFRSWWKLGMLLLFLSSLAVVYMTIQRFLLNPTYIVREQIVETTKEFPSVLICPEILFAKWKIDKFVDSLEIPSDLNTTYIKRHINQLSAFFTTSTIYRTNELENLEHLLEYNLIDVRTAVETLTSSCEDTLIRCRWQGSIVNCSELFTMELTGDGFCCVFNGRTLKRHLLKGFDNEKTYRTSYAGFNRPLMIAVNQSQPPTNVDLSYKWVLVKSGRNFVEASVNGTPLNPRSEHWEAMHVRNLQIGDEARSLSEDLKKCRMGSDRLAFYPVYTRRYCIIECEMQRILKQCHCVSHVHPLPDGIQYCRARSLPCAQRARDFSDSECNCPTECDVAKDYVTSSRFRLVPSSNLLDPFYKGLNFKRVTIVRAYLKSRKEYTNTRWSVFNKIDLFSQLGGVYNLFFGCSVLTLLELFILGVNWWKDTKRKNAITKHEENIQTTNGRRNSKNNVKITLDSK